MDITEAFICGGPYNGTMFKSAQGMPPYSKYPRHSGIVKKNLQCPWCSGVFLGPSDELLTEHGKIKAGQKTYDPDFSIVWQEGPAIGKLMYIKDAPEKIGNFYFDEEEKQSIVNNIEWKTASELKEMYPNLEKVEQVDAILEKSFQTIDARTEDIKTKFEFVEPELPEIISKSQERRIEVQTGKKRGRPSKKVSK